MLRPLLHIDKQNARICALWNPAHVSSSVVKMSLGLSHTK